MEEQSDSVFWASLFEQKKTLQKLIEESRADGDFYLLLIISSFISTLGLILDNTIIVIGGMLVAPLLFPILSLAMGITTANKNSIIRSSNIILKSIFTIFFIALITSFLFRNVASGVSEKNILLQNIEPNLIFFLVSFAAGVAAAYTWVKQNLSSALPGIAVTVALIPPISAISIGLIYYDSAIVSGALALFIINIFGITISALIVFSLFGFSKLQKEEEKLIQQEEIEDLSHVKNKLEATKERLEKVNEKIEDTVQESKRNEDNIE